MVRDPALTFLEIQCWLLGLYPALAVERSNLVSDAGLDYVGSLVWLFNVVV